MKMVEDLVYNILRTKFGESKPETWWDEKRNRPLGLGGLISNLADNRREFEYDQPDLIKKFLELVNPFAGEVGKKAHYIVEYLESVDELERLKIPEVISVLLELRDRIKPS